MIRHDDFEPVPFATRKAVQRSRRPVTYRGLQRLKKNRLAVAGGIIICLIALWALIGPAFSPYTYDGQNFAEANAAPSVLHWYRFFGPRFIYACALRGTDILVHRYRSGTY